MYSNHSSAPWNAYDSNHNTRYKRSTIAKRKQSNPAIVGDNFSKLDKFSSEEQKYPETQKLKRNLKTLQRIFFFFLIGKNINK